MEILLANHSSYPPPSNNPRGGKGAAEDARVAAVIREQEAAGLDIVTDGHAAGLGSVPALTAGLDGIRWVDLAGSRSGSGWVPVVTGPIRRIGALVCGVASAARAAASRPVKAVIPGPYSLARLARVEGGPYRESTALAADLAEALAGEVAELGRAGISFVQVDEPAILQSPCDFRLVRRLLEPLWNARGAAQLIVATGNGTAEEVYAQLDSLPADVLALDFPSSPRLMDAVAATGAGKVLALGLIGDPSLGGASVLDLARAVERMLKRYLFGVIHLQPSRGLGYLSGGAARATLTALAQIRSEVQSA